MKISIARLKEIIMEEVARATAIEGSPEEEVPTGSETPRVKEESLNIEIVDDE